MPIEQYDDVKIKTQIGSPDNIGILPKLFTETVGVEEGTTVISQYSIGNSFILGHSVNGILGVTGKNLGVSGRALTLFAVVNPNNIFNEHFRFTDFEDTGTTTATFNTTTHETTFTAGQILQSLQIAYNTGTITNATITLDSTTNLTLYLSADGGSHWETATSGTLHTFTVSGTDLRYKLVASGVATVTLIMVEYG
jgi:hypothetical protein